MKPVSDVVAAIGRTPLIKLRAASEATGCTIYGKAEFMNPGGSVKDRAAMAMINDAVARGAGLSRPHFYKLFRTQTGLTPNLYVNTLRMEQAIDRLVGSEISVADIGYDLGFSSQSGFTRFFAANVGMAPTQYRRVAHVL